MAGCSVEATCSPAWAVVPVDRVLDVTAAGLKTVTKVESTHPSCTFLQYSPDVLIPGYLCALEIS